MAAGRDEIRDSLSELFRRRALSGYAASASKIRLAPGTSSGGDS
jgi:hypothetical protein